MSTIHHHHHDHLHLWWFAAAVAAGLLAVLMTTVFAASSGSGDIAPADTGGSTVDRYHGPVLRELCFAAHPGFDIELARPNCSVAR